MSCDDLLDSRWAAPESDPDISYIPESGIATIHWGGETLTLDILGDQACKRVPTLGLIVEQVLADARQTPSRRSKGLVQRFEAFARQPSTGTAAAVPFAPTIRLWLAGNRDRTIARTTADKASVWVLRATDFEGIDGPFSAVQSVASAMARGTPLASSEGPHSHCAGPALPRPPSLAGLDQVSIQPATQESCLEWFAVDLFVDGSGQVRAVRLDLWGP